MYPSEKEFSEINDMFNEILFSWITQNVDSESEIEKQYIKRKMILLRKMFKMSYLCRKPKITKDSTDSICDSLMRLYVLVMNMGAIKRNGRTVSIEILILKYLTKSKEVV
jgi:hypothetical protein